MIADGTTMTSDDDFNKNSNHSDIRVLSPSFFTIILFLLRKTMMLNVWDAVMYQV